ncbi:galactan 5-O-arabinofuranosyltransferase [Mycobacterium sp. shizuoka-1]|uniref:galactan 5-O-arabinofuranosyltransferase n=1 Tax=Mycobacterium sp. shizuoka-1 TaxID=2039281 RepID=UPI000C06334B|nr:galactan 5-O-arabinofuranosyltransferase [Mycobacterium sp. shizuoka-1]GAY15937.1 arabinofuranosyltransferase AftA [Mycobacterium sp. shizuoka-1]
MGLVGKNALATVGQMIAAVAVAVAVSVIALIAISRVQWPAFPSSNQLHALTTVGQVGCLVLLLGTGFVWRRGHQWVARIAASVFLSAFTVVTLGMPLGATRLYLFGISVDQQFRTEYLSRLAQSPALHDMTYAGLPTFYPAGWFWIGGRAAALTGTPAWEMFKPWAIVSIAIAVVLAMTLWSALVRFEYALIVTVATAAVTLAYSSPEPYAATITVLIPPVLVLAWSGLRGKTRGGGWAAVGGVGLFLGVAATFYTLLLGYTAFTVVAMAVIVAIARRSLEPLLRLALIALIAILIALITWLPFVLRALRQPMSDTGSAQHYLPADGAVLTFPMLQFSLLGALCMLGTLWLVWRARSSTRAAALAIGVLTVYGWSVLSMLTTLVGTTLLSFRLQPTLTVLLSAAGVFGFIEVTLALATRSTRKVIGVGTAIGLIGAIGFSQDIPDVLRPDLTVAYTDTDGYGQRGDRRPPGAEKYYPEVDAAILRATGRPREDTVVLTADYSFLSYYPYYGFQGLTSHYANPLAEFERRAAAIESWADLKNADELVHALDTLPWQPPTVFLMRRGANDTYTLRLAQDVYPNQPNVRRYAVEFDGKLFSGPHFTVKTIGPFVLAIRNP